MKITISNYYNQNASVEIPDDTDASNIKDTFSRLLVAVGFSPDVMEGDESGHFVWRDYEEEQTDRENGAKVIDLYNEVTTLKKKLEEAREEAKDNERELRKLQQENQQENQQ